MNADRVAFDHDDDDGDDDDDDDDGPRPSLP